MNAFTFFSNEEAERAKNSKDCWHLLMKHKNA